MAHRTLSIDAGQSGCRLRVVGAGRPGPTIRAPGLPFGVPTDEALLQALSPVVRSALDEAAVDRTGWTIAAGVTGLHGRPTAARALLEAWGSRHDVRLVVVADDSLTGFLGALGVQAGVVVAAGTGAVALATDAKTRCARADGVGPILGDAGSGFWVGRQGLIEAFRYVDGRGGSPELLDRAGRRYGDLTAFPALLAASPARGSLVASFAEEVAGAARGGDRVAEGIWREAARLLAETAVAALRRVGLDQAPVTLSWTGALFSAGRLLLTPFTEAVRAVAPAAVLRSPQGTPLDGAALLGQCPRPSGLEALVDVASREDGK